MTRLGNESTESQGTPHKSARKPVFSTPDLVSRRGGSGKNGGHGPQSVTPVKRMQLPSLCTDMGGKREGDEQMDPLSWLAAAVAVVDEGACVKVDNPSRHSTHTTQSTHSMPFQDPFFDVSKVVVEVVDLSKDRRGVLLTRSDTVEQAVKGIVGWQSADGLALYDDSNAAVGMQLLVSDLDTSRTFYLKTEWSVLHKVPAEPPALHSRVTLASESLSESGPALR